MWKLAIVGMSMLLGACGQSTPDPAPTPSVSEAQATVMVKEEKQDDCKYVIESVMESSLKPLLRDPDSYEKINFSVLKLTDTDVEYGAILDYRSKNGFGGYETGRAKVEYDADNCKLTRVDQMQ